VSTLLAKRASNAPQPREGTAGRVKSGLPRPGVFGDVRFVPARWLVLLLSLVQLLLSGRRISKLGIAGFVWSFTPRTLKLAVAVMAMAATIVVVGAIAAITLLALQLA
jgi:hypothetical protein